MNEYFRNPCTLWLKWLFSKLKLEHRFKNQNLKIGYMSLILDLEPGIYNTIYEYVTLRNVVLDDYTYISKNCEIMNTKFGKFCSVGSNCKIGLGTHPVDLVSTHPMFFSTKKQTQITFAKEDAIKEYKEIIVGNDVWIGTNSLVLDGVIIGNGAVIAAGSVVTKDVPDYAVVAGVPAKIIKYRFAPEQIIKLREFAWWNKDDLWLQNHQMEMLDIEKLLALE